MAWQLQSILWMFLPEHRDVNFTTYVFITLLGFCLAAMVAGRAFHRPVIARLAVASALLLAITWVAVHNARPAWLELAIQTPAPTVTTPALQWQAVDAGMEVAEMEIKADGTVVDNMVLVRLDPRQYAFHVQWDGEKPRTAEQWQHDLGVALVVNGSYFGSHFEPLTPLRHKGIAYGPSHYTSSHGAFVANGTTVDIIDLQGRDVSQALGQYPEAMVSYPLLVDPQGVNRATESHDWLASRNFVAIDHDGRVILGSTKTGFFTIKRLGDFLKSSPLDIRVALNLDGGPLVSQVIQTQTYSRRFHGKAEISDGADTIRARWHDTFASQWPLPIVLTAQRVQDPDAM